jgi:hypothetical protein
VKKFAPAHEPAGVAIRLRLHFGKGTQLVAGELLAVQDSGLLLRDSTRIVFVPNDSVRYGETTTRGTGLSFARKPVGSTREQLRLLSRFPGGVSADLLSSLLAAYGRDSVETAR